MYILIYKPKDSYRETTEILEGVWPSNYLESLLEKKYSLIVISLYSNTIKIPTDEWGSPEDRIWNEFPIPMYLFEKLKL